MIALEFIDKGTIAGLRRIGAQVKNPRRLVAAVVGRGANELRAHFLVRDQNYPNKLGGKRLHFWREIRDSVTTRITSPTQGKIQVTDFRFNQKVYGGPITPKQKESLAFGVTPESYGLTVKQFERETGLKLFRLRRSGGVLTNVLMADFGGDVKVEFVLSKRVDQEADPKALPDRGKFNAALLDAGERFLTREVIQNKSTAT